MIDMDECYEICPACGMPWKEHDYHKKDKGKVNPICKQEVLIANDRPRFYMMDLTNYTDDFLREIIQWMDRKIKFLEDK